MRVGREIVKFWALCLKFAAKSPKYNVWAKNCENWSKAHKIHFFRPKRITQRPTRNFFRPTRINQSTK